MPRVSTRIASRQLGQLSSANITNVARATPQPAVQTELFEPSALGTVAAFAQVGNKLAQEALEREQKRQTNEALQNLSQFEIDTLQRQQEINLEDIPEGSSLFQEHKRSFDEAEARFLAEVPDFIRGDMQLRTAKLRESYAARSIGEQSRRDGIQAKMQYEKSLLNYKNLAALQPHNASKYQAEIQGIIDNLPLDPISRQALAEEAKQGIRSSVVGAKIESDPAGFLNEAEENPGKYTKEEINTAKDWLLKQDEIEATNRLIDDITSNAGVYEQFVGGEMTLSKVHELEVQNGPSPLTTMMKSKLLKSIPKPSATQQLTAFNELSQKLENILVNTDGGEIRLNSQSIKQYQGFQQDVYEAVQSRLISEDEGEAFLKNYSQGILNSLAENRSNPYDFRIAPGIQDPYAIALNRFDKYLKDNNVEGDLRLKKGLILGFRDYLGEYQSTGNSRTDSEKVEAAIQDTIDNVDKLTTRMITVPYKVMEDANGNRARVYVDGTIEEIN